MVLFILDLSLARKQRLEQNKKIFIYQRISCFSEQQTIKESQGMTTMANKESGKTITKKNLINLISQEKGIHPNDVRSVIQSFLDKMTDTLADGNRLEFRDFGVFEVVQRKQKIGRNPKNASVPIVIPARKAVKFTPGKNMKKRIEETQ